MLPVSMAVRLGLASVTLAPTWNEELEQGRPARLHRVVSILIEDVFTLPCFPMRKAFLKLSLE